MGRHRLAPQAYRATRGFRIVARKVPKRGSFMSMSIPDLKAKDLKAKL